MAADHQTCEKALSKAFDEIDKDKDGFIDAKELEAVLCKYHSCGDCKDKKDAAKISQEAAEFIGQADKNKDHKVSRQEFTDFYIKKYAAK